MTNTVTPLVDDVYTTVRAFLLSIVPAGVEVLQGLQNRVTLPAPLPGFIIMQAINLVRLRTNEDTWDITDPAPTGLSISNALQVTLQLDCYGPDSGNWAAMINSLWRDSVGVDAMAPTCAPLYADNARLVPLVDGEEQYEERWSVTAELEYNPTTVTLQDFADSLEVGLINVDVTYPPQGAP